METGKRIWIQCQNKHCERWRRLPKGMDSFPGKFTCDQNTWEPAKSTCKGLGLESKPTPAAAAAPSVDENGPNNRARKLMKKINEIQLLKRRQASGEELEENQLKKVKGEAELQAQLEAMGHPFDAMGVMSPVLSGSKRREPSMSDSDTEEEETVAAKKPKHAAVDIGAMQSQLKQLTKKKAAAVEEEDYGTAKTLKGEIDNLNTQIEQAEKAAKAAEKAAKAAAEKAAKEKAAKEAAAKAKAAKAKADEEEAAKKKAKAEKAEKAAAKAKAAEEEAAAKAKPSKKRKKTDAGDVESMQSELKQLTKKKAAAVEAEDYGVAKSLKGEIDSLTAQIAEAEEAAQNSGPDVAALEKQISELKAKKAAAVESEDYGAAKKIKGEIDALTAEIDSCQTDNKAEEEAAAAKAAEEEAAKAKAKAAKKVASLEKQMTPLKAKKAAAVEAEDYGSAKKIKGEMDAIAAEIEALQ